MRYYFLFLLGLFLIPSTIAAQIFITNATEKNGAVDDGKPMDPSLNLKLETIGFGCGTGFGGWVTPQDAETEKTCDEKNLKQFQSILGECSVKDQQSKIVLYDLDKDGCATCKDYALWKDTMKELFKREERKASGENLFFAPCDKK